jgi:hypothetical protein
LRTRRNRAVVDRRNLVGSSSRVESHAARVAQVARDKRFAIVDQDHRTIDKEGKVTTVKGYVKHGT